MSAPPNFDLEAIGDVLFGLRNSAIDADAVHWPGVYALFLDDRSALAPLTVAASGLLYIRMTITGTELRNQFTGSTAASTLRRSLGALLKAELELKVLLPRRAIRSTSPDRDFCFDEAGERRLSEWMGRHVTFSFGHAQRGLRMIERRLTRHHQPALNLMTWSNPQRHLVTELRKACVTEGRGRVRAESTS